MSRDLYFQASPNKIQVKYFCILIPLKIQAQIKHKNINYLIQNVFKSFKTQSLLKTQILA